MTWAKLSHRAAPGKRDEHFSKAGFSQHGKGWVEKKLEEIGITQTGSKNSSSTSVPGTTLSNDRTGEVLPGDAIRYQAVDLLSPFQLSGFAIDSCRADLLVN
jgi:hypothetical protein